MFPRLANAAELYFNSRPCGRGDPFKSVIQGCQVYFNSRPCGRGDILIDCGVPFSRLFQFTPLREGRHNLALFDPLAVLISIHAPAGGATKNQGINIYPLFLFQFTPLREGRLFYIMYITPKGHISIHAPAGGAT